MSEQLVFDGVLDDESDENLSVITYKFSLGEMYFSCSCICDENLTSIFLSVLSKIYYDIMNGEQFAINLGDVCITVYDKVETLAKSIDVKKIKSKEDLETIVEYELADDDLAISFVEQVCSYDDPEFYIDFEDEEDIDE